MNETAYQVLLFVEVLHFATDLRHNERRVAAALLAHYNRQTGRCDPSLERIAALLDVDRSTVVRAIRRLVGHGYFERTRHGGRYLTNSYDPNWSRFEADRKDWKRRFSESARRRGAIESSRKAQACAIDGGTRAQQTPPPNQSIEPARRAPKPLPPSSRDAARSAAERRWAQALTDLFASEPDINAAIISRIDEQLNAAATEAELKNRGAGLRLILNRVVNPPPHPKEQPDD